MLQFVLGIVTIIFLYKWLNSRPQNFPPGPPSIPIFGSLPFIKNINFHMELENLREKYGPIIGFKFGIHPAVAVCGPAEVLELLKREDFAARPSLIAISRPSQGIFFGSGVRWKDQRRFTLRHLRDFGFGKSIVNDMIHEEAIAFFKYGLEGKKTVQMVGFFNKSATNVLWAMMAGHRLDYDDPDAQYMLDAAQKFLRQGNLAGGGIINSIPYLKKIISVFYELQEDRITSIMNAFSLRSINEHRATKTETPRDFLDVYLSEMDNPDKKPSFDEGTLLEVCRDLITAGAESSSNTITFCVLYLVLHPEWQENLLKEIDENIGKRMPIYEKDRTSLPLVEAFISEVMRVNTISPMAVPHAPKKDTYLGGYFFAKDTFVNVSLWCLLQDKAHWGDPENFRPERFLASDGAYVKDPYMVTFSAGPRVCIGESLAVRFTFLYFVALLQRFSFSVPKGAPKPSTLCISGFTSSPQDFHVAVVAR